MVYSNNEMATVLFCSHLALENIQVKPYTTNEWNSLQEIIRVSNFSGPEIFLEHNWVEFCGKLGFTEAEIDRINQLLSRAAIVGLILEKYSKRGIFVVTRGNSQFPKLLRKRLKRKTPPLLFYCGDLGIANKMGIAIVGSRSLEERGIEFVQELAKKAVDEKMVIFSGGARGADTIAQQTAIQNGGLVVNFVADSMVKKIQDRDIVKAIENKQLLLLSDTNPDIGFTVAKAMNRNKYIYTSSCGSVAVAADQKKGGTWNGAIENINHNWVPIGVWDTDLYTGNKELIRRGGVAITELESFSLKKFIHTSLPGTELSHPYQMELFPEKIGETKLSYHISQRTAFDMILPSLLDELQTARSLQELCQIFDVVKSQMESWLAKAIAEGLIVKTKRPVRYQVR